MNSVLSLIFMNPLFAASLAGLATACWLGYSWRLQSFPMFNSIVAFLVFSGSLMLGVGGAIGIADYHSMDGGEEPSFWVYWSWLGAMAFLTQFGLGAVRASVAR